MRVHDDLLSKAETRTMAERTSPATQLRLTPFSGQDVCEKFGLDTLLIKTDQKSTPRGHDLFSTPGQDKAPVYGLEGASPEEPQQIKSAGNSHPIKSAGNSHQQPETGANMERGHCPDLGEQCASPLRYGSFQEMQQSPGEGTSMQYCCASK